MFWVDKQAWLQDALDPLSNIIIKASCIKAAARLRELTLASNGRSLAVKKQQETRGTSWMTMVDR